MISHHLASKKRLCQAVRVRPVHNLKVFQLRLMLIATKSYSKFEIIQLQKEESVAKPNVSRKTLFILEVLRALTLPLFTNCLQSVFSIKRM